MPLPQVSDIALKEWAVAVKSLGSGDQVLILRKGGIHREDRDFRLVHPLFLLYPTYEHQKAELIKPEIHTALEQTLTDADGASLIHFRYFCQVTDRFELRDEATLDSVSAWHIWSEEYARKRLHWRPSQPLTVALLRVYELQQPQTLPVLAEYSGCKSWVELGRDVSLGLMQPVLSDEAYESRADEVRSILDAAAAAV